ncbi:MAG TPA: TonB-dependent receptor [Pseudomonadota bacterium]|nr:TonB-dependent receptor [Pseudomonadota bacterium]
MHLRAQSCRKTYRCVHRRVPRGAGLALAFWLSGGSAYAATADDADVPEEKKARSELEGVSAVTLKRATVFKSPRATSAVDHDELRVRPPRASGDAVSDEDGVFVQRSSYSFATPAIRGQGEGHVLVLVDGIRLNSTLTSTIAGGFGGINLVDPYAIDAVELVRGPGLVSYGSDGLGGTIQLRTRKPAPIAGSSVELNAGVRGIYTSYDQSFAGSVSGGGRWNRFALDTAFSARRFGELTGGDRAGTQPLTGYNEGGLSLGVGADLGRGTLVLVYQGVRQYDGLRSERSQPRDLYVLSEVARDLAYLRYDGIFELSGRAIEASATASFQRQNETASRQLISEDTSNRHINGVNVLGVSANARADLGRGGYLSAGLDGYFEWVSSIAERATVSDGPSAAATATPELARYPGGSTAQTFAVFLQDEIDLERLFSGSESKQPGRLRLLIGGRGGANLLSIGRDDRALRLLGALAPNLEAVMARLIASPVYAGSLHLRYEFYPGLALSAGFMTSSRPPNLDDYARLDIGRPGLLLPTGENLRSESAYAAEAGFRIAYQRVEGSAVYAFTYIDSPLSVVPVVLAGQPCLLSPLGGCADRFLTRRSEPSAQLHSVEGSARVYLLGGLSVVGTINYTHAEVRRLADPRSPARTEPLWRVPPLYGLGALQLRRPRSVLTFVEVGLRWALAQDRLSSQDVYDSTICLPTQLSCTKTPGYLIISARASLRLSRRMYLSAALENVTNSTYRLHGSGVLGPGLGGNVSFEGNY